MAYIGNSLAQGLISGANIQDGTVDTPDIKDSAVTTPKVADGSVHTAKIADSAVSTAKLADGGIHTAKIADGAITTEKIAAGAVATVDIADAAVTTAKVADGAVTSAKLASGAAVANIGYTPIRKSGDTGLSGYFQKSISLVDVSDFGGTATPGSTQRDIFGWKLVADVTLNNQSGGTQYIDLKTNVISESAMMYFKLEGYAYNYGNVHSYHGLYMYTGSQILNKYTNNLAGQITFYDSYKASDGSLCLKINMGAVFYTSARGRLYVQSHDDNFDALQIVSVKRTNSTAAQY